MEVEGENSETLSLKVPLLTADEKQQAISTGSRRESAADQATKGTTSLAKTSFRGLNAMEDETTMSVPFLPGEIRYGKDEEGELSSHASGAENVSFLKTCLNGINALSGIGILSVPYALASGGWLSIILLLLIAAATFYAGLLMKKCMEMHPDIRTYPDIGEHAFGRIGRLVVTTSMYIELYLVATGFLIIEGDNLNNIFPNMELEMAGISVGGRQFFVILVSLVIMPSVWLDNLSIISYVSASGVFASAIILASIIWTAASGEVGFDQKGTLVDWNGIPTAVSLYAFCYCAHPVFPTLYTSMRKRHQFTNVLLVCFVLSTLGYASMAILGYRMFGSNVESQITLNLPTDKISSRVAIYTTLVNPISKYALMVTPITNSLKELLPRQYKNRLTNILMGTTLVISTVIVALSIPFFGYLMSLVGAFLSVTASIILPCLCYLKISGTYRRFSCEMVAVVAMITMGVAIGVFGTDRSLRQIIEHL